MTTEMNWDTAVCRTPEAAELFQSEVLDYSPDGEEYADITAEEHAALATEKARVEDAAVDVCMGCPLMLACEQWALANRPYGVAGGRTADELDAMRRTAKIKVADDSRLIDAIVNRRGARNQIDDNVVEMMTRGEADAQQIAYALGCHPRSVVRARARIRKREEAALAAAATAKSPSVALLEDFDASEPTLAEVTEMAIADGASEAIAATAVLVTGGDTASDLLVQAAQQSVTAQPLAEATGQAATASITSITRGRGQSRAGRPARRTQTQAPMRAIYDVLADGQWHQRTALIAAGVPHVDPQDAIAYWFVQNSSKQADGTRALPASKENVAVEQRIASGAWMKVANSLRASCTNHAHTLRGGPNGTDQDLFQFAPAALAAWQAEIADTGMLVAS